LKSFRLPPLPYASDALSPHLSADTLLTHHNKHHKAYIDKVNTLVEGTPKASWTLERLVKESSGPLFNNAAQAWNHEFYWRSLRPAGGPRPPAALGDAISKSFGGLAEFRTAFSEQAAAHFGSGWAWLVANTGGKLAIVVTHDAGTPLKDGGLPLLTCDLWEHAYYLDRKQDKPAYLKAFWQVADWSFAATNLERGTPYVSIATQGAERVTAGRTAAAGAE
jgi:superoxide dismutase, Fe-Mn family